MRFEVVARIQFEADDFKSAQEAAKEIVQDTSFWPDHNTSLQITSCPKQLKSKIKTVEEYNKILHRINEIFDAPEDSPAGKECEKLCALVEEYDDIHFYSPPPSFLRAVKFMMEQKGISVNDLVSAGIESDFVKKIVKGETKVSNGLKRKLRKILDIQCATL